MFFFLFYIYFFRRILPHLSLPRNQKVKNKGGEEGVKGRNERKCFKKNYKSAKITIKIWKLFFSEILIPPRRKIKVNGKWRRDNAREECFENIMCPNTLFNWNLKFSSFGENAHKESKEWKKRIECDQWQSYPSSSSWLKIIDFPLATKNYLSSPILTEIDIIWEIGFEWWWM